MNVTYPAKLSKGDNIRVISPARSMSMIDSRTIQYAIKKLNEIGYTVSFGNHVFESDIFMSSKIESRIYDIHDAFLDDSINCILTSIGGYNSNQLLDYIDYSIIKKNPKIICGYSDITCLLNAIYTKTGLVSYSGPHFSNFGMKEGLDYTLEYFKKCLGMETSFYVHPSKQWSDDSWWVNQEERNFIPNAGPVILQEGEAEGNAIGGNLSTLILLDGTSYMPSLKNKIVFLENTHSNRDNYSQLFDRQLQALTLQPNFHEIQGIIFGRAERSADFSHTKLKKILKSKSISSDIPIVAGFDFGHTTPQITFPIGGEVSLMAKHRKISLCIY